MDEMRIVMLGKTGAGKSSLANTILGEDVFQIGLTGISETRECRSVTRRVDGRDVTLIDTPGLFDTDRPKEELKPEIVKCITECSPGPHAFIVVLKMETFTVQEQEVINKIIEYFSEEAFKYATVLFTRGDDLQEEQTVEQYFQNNQLVSDLMKKCGGRCHVIDNKYWKNNQLDEYRSNQFQVKQLMKTIDHMIEANKGSCYTNEMLQAVETLIQEEEKKIRQSSGNKTNKEIREEAKKRAYRHLINLAGVTTGVLLGALLGGVVMVGIVVKALKESLSEEQVRRALPAVGVGAGVGAAAGAAAVGGVGLVLGAKAAGISAGSLLVVGALEGAIQGGFTGYGAAQEADRAGEAANRALDAVIGTVTSLFKGPGITAENTSESQPLIGPDS